MSALETIHLTPADALNRLQRHSNEFIELFAHGSLVVEYYKPEQAARIELRHNRSLFIHRSG